jgi:hypothetical protein
MKKGAGPFQKSFETRLAEQAGDPNLDPASQSGKKHRPTAALKPRPQQPKSWYNCRMETISCNIADLAADERTVIERFVGRPLAENQRVVVQVMDADLDESAAPPRTVADYAILADLDDAEADRLTEAMTLRSPGRDVPL